MGASETQEKIIVTQNAIMHTNRQVDADWDEQLELGCVFVYQTVTLQMSSQIC